MIPADVHAIIQINHACILFIYFILIFSKDDMIEYTICIYIYQKDMKT